MQLIQGWGCAACASRAGGYHRVRSKMLKFKKGAYVRQRHARGRAVVATGVPEAGLRGARQQLREEHARGGAEREET